MMKHKFNSKFIQDEQIKNLYDIAKSVAIPKVINEQMCSGGVGGCCFNKRRKYLHRCLYRYRLFTWYVCRAKCFVNNDY